MLWASGITAVNSKLYGLEEALTAAQDSVRCQLVFFGGGGSGIGVIVSFDERGLLRLVFLSLSRCADVRSVWREWGHSQLFEEGLLRSRSRPLRQTSAMEPRSTQFSVFLPQTHCGQH